MLTKKKFHLAYYVGVALIILLSLGPILWTFIISLTPESAMLQQGPILPKTLVFQNYIALFDSTSKTSSIIAKGLINSIYISAITLIVGMPIAVCGGYSLARYQFTGKSLILGCILLTIPIPVFATIIPVYSLFRDMDLLNSMFWTAIIYCSSFLPLNIWIIMNYIKELPKELWQAAELDGFNEWQIFKNIILPLSKPIVLTSALIMFLMSWKQYIIPSILISSADSKVLTMIMSEFMTRDAIQYGNIAAAGIIAVIPPAVIAVLFRRFLISGLTSGSVKQ